MKKFSSSQWFTLEDYHVYPSEQPTISVESDIDTGDVGSQRYRINNCRGFEDGATQYLDSQQEIQFVQKLENGTVIPGLQSEQLALILLDRVKMLNKDVPNPQFNMMREGLEMFLQGCMNRVQDRVDRDVMGTDKE